MNEILQQRIEEAAEAIVEDYNHYQFLNDGTKDVYTQSAVLFMLNEMAQFIISNQWISVEEALPPSDDRLKSFSIDVMVKNEYGKVTSAWYDYERKEWHLCYGEIAGDDLIDSKITHWMPIPQIEGGEK